MYKMISWWARNPKAANLLMVSIIIVGIANRGLKIAKQLAKNIESNRLYYTEEAQFGIEGIGYTADAPGLAPSKSDQMEVVKEAHIKLGDLLKEDWVNYGGEGAKV